jgi:hypothetical protein
VLSRYRDGLRAGRPSFATRQKQKIFFFFTASRSALGPSPLTSGYDALSQETKRLGREAGYSPQSSAEVMNDGAYHHSPTSLHGMVLKYLSTGTTFSNSYSVTDILSMCY